MYNLLSSGSGGSDSARYCYSVWLRHLVLAQQHGLDDNPQVIVELGPGDSLGLGLAALLSGSARYLAVDVVDFVETERNLQVLNELVELFQRRSDIPDASEFPRVKPQLDQYDFPKHILTETRLGQSLAPARLQRIRECLLDTMNKDSMIQYRAPWSNVDLVEHGSADLICSQAVLEHVDDLSCLYEFMKCWLKEGGYLSHQIDFKCHGTAKDWNGHWTHSDILWKLIRGNRPYLINREPFSTHLSLLERNGFELVYKQLVPLESHLSRESLLSKFEHLSEEDLRTSGAYYLAQKTSF